MCLIEKPKILRSNFLLDKYTHPIINKKFKNFSNSDSYDKIFRFYNEKIIPKYNLKNCIMEKESEEEGINAEYYFFLKEKLSPKEISELSLKINIDLYNFCKMENIKSYLKTLIIILD